MSTKRGVTRWWTPRGRKFGPGNFQSTRVGERFRRSEAVYRPTRGACPQHAPQAVHISRRVVHGSPGVIPKGGRGVWIRPCRKSRGATYGRGVVGGLPYPRRQLG